MPKDVASQPKSLLDRSEVYSSKWVKLYLDHYLSNGGQPLEYPVVARSDSVIALVRQGGKFVLTDEQLRPGVREHTLDFPGGRVDDTDPNEAVVVCIRREFQLPDDATFPQPTPLLQKPLAVDSAFSSQKVFGYFLDMPDSITLGGTSYSSEELLEKLNCLQCRAMLLEWLHQNAGNS